MVEGMLAGLVANTTADIINEFLKLKKTRKKEELETDEWKNIEKAYLDHLKWRFEYPKKVFGQQMIVSWLITILVVLLIGSGLYFSFIQLDSAIKHGDFSNLKTDMAIKEAGDISFKSSLVGATVLIISLSFFYLYLKHVFQIKYPLPPHVSFKETDVKEFLKKDKQHGAKE